MTTYPFQRPFFFFFKESTSSHHSSSGRKFIFIENLNLFIRSIASRWNSSTRGEGMEPSQQTPPLMWLHLSKVLLANKISQSWIRVGKKRAAAAPPRNIYHFPGKTPTPGRERETVRARAKWKSRKLFICFIRANRGRQAPRRSSRKTCRWTTLETTSSDITKTTNSANSSNWIKRRLSQFKQGKILNILNRNLHNEKLLWCVVSFHLSRYIFSRENEGVAGKAIPTFRKVDNIPQQNAGFRGKLMMMVVVVESRSTLNHSGEGKWLDGLFPPLACQAKWYANYLLREKV